LYERFCLLADAMNLPAHKGRDIRQFIAELKSRMEVKASALQRLLPGITLDSSRDAISRAGVMLSWSRVERVFDSIETQRDLEEQAWDLIDMLPACYEPQASDLPLAPLPRVTVRTFARRFEMALRLEPPHAYQLAANLFGTQDWFALVGESPFLPVAEPLYPYQVEMRDGQAFARLEPCAAAHRADEEFKALTQLRQEMFIEDLVQNEFVDQPGLLCAGSTGVVLSLAERQYDIAEFRARTTLKAVEVCYPEDCRLPLAPGSQTHLFYVRVRTALFAALLFADKDDEANVERDYLLTRGREYRAKYERWLKDWAPKDALLKQKTALRLVS
jgi:hypothetical protein